MDTCDVAVRFEVERQGLALMDHPIIASVFDAGGTPPGRPKYARLLSHPHKPANPGKL